MIFHIMTSGIYALLAWDTADWYSGDARRDSFSYRVADVRLHIYSRNL